VVSLLKSLSISSLVPENLAATLSASVLALGMAEKLKVC